MKVYPPLHAEGDKVEIICEANGLPNPDYSWNTTSTDIQLSPDKSIIRIESLKESHLGNYSCTVQNKHGTDHMSATLDFASKHVLLIEKYFCGKDVRLHVVQAPGGYLPTTVMSIK